MDSIGTNRLEAFSDGVIAVIITNMVLELKIPRDTTLASLRGVLPQFLSYLLSFLVVAIMWVNHHHMLHSARRAPALVEQHAPVLDVARPLRHRLHGQQSPRCGSLWSCADAVLFVVRPAAL